MFTSSGGVFAENSGGVVNEGNMIIGATGGRGGRPPLISSDFVLMLV